MFLRVLQGYKEAFGPEHMSTLDTVNSLARMETPRSMPPRRWTNNTRRLNQACEKPTSEAPVFGVVTSEHFVMWLPCQTVEIVYKLNIFNEFSVVGVACGCYVIYFCNGDICLIDFILPKPYQSFSCVLVGNAYIADLITALFLSILVDAYSIRPEKSGPACMLYLSESISQLRVTYRTRPSQTIRT
jgi:hypothetical protein